MRIVQPPCILHYATLYVVIILHRSHSTTSRIKVNQASVEWCETVNTSTTVLRLAALGTAKSLRKSGQFSTNIQNF